MVSSFDRYGIQVPLLPALSFLNQPQGILSFCLTRDWGEVGDLRTKPGRIVLLWKSWDTMSRGRCAGAQEVVRV